MTKYRYNGWQHDEIIYCANIQGQAQVSYVVWQSRCKDETKQKFKSIYVNDRTAKQTWDGILVEDGRDGSSASDVEDMMFSIEAMPWITISHVLTGVATL